MTTWEVHPTGSVNLWRVAQPGAAPWEGVAVNYYPIGHLWLCSQCDPFRGGNCEHIAAVMAIKPVLPKGED